MLFYDIKTLITCFLCIFLAFSTFYSSFINSYNQLEAIFQSMINNKQCIIIILFKSIINNTTNL